MAARHERAALNSAKVMDSKFDKQFGSNPPRNSEGIPNIAFAESIDDAEHRRHIARLRNRRRIIGLCAITLAVLIVAPSLFEPNDVFAERGAQLEIPALKSSPVTAVIPISQTAASQIKQEVSLQVSSLGDRANAAAKSLSLANPVAADEKPMPPEPKKARQVSKGETSAKKPEKTAVKSQKFVDGQYYFIQVIATSNKQSALKRVERLEKLGLKPYVETVSRRGTQLWRVRIGKFESPDQASEALAVLRKNRISNGGVKSATIQK